VVSAVAVGRLEAAQESVLGVHFRQARLDDLTRAFSGDEVRFDDPAEVVLRPRWPLLPVDDFLAGEVGSAEVAIVIDEIALRVLEVVRNRGGSDSSLAPSPT